MEAVIVQVVAAGGILAALVVIWGLRSLSLIHILKIQPMARLS